MYNNNIFGDRKITAEQAKLYEFISLPDQNLRINKEGNLSYNSSTKIMQYYDGSTWIDLDSTGPPSNLWQIDSTTYIKPLATYTDGIKVNKITPISGTTLTIAGDLTSNEILKILDLTTPTKQVQIKYDLDAGYIQSLDTAGPTYKSLYINNLGGNCYMGNGTFDAPSCKFNNIYERTTAAGITFNQKINVNDLYSFGTTNQDMTINMLGNGSLKMNFDSIGGIKAYQATTTSALRNYFGVDATHNLELRYYGGGGIPVDDYASLSYNYGGMDTSFFKMQSKKIDARMTLLNTETGTFNIGQYNDGNQLQIGYYYDLATAANRYAYIKYYGASTNALLFKQNGEVEGNMNKIYVDNLYEKTTSNGIICNNTIKVNIINGIADVDSGNIFGIPITDGFISADNINFSPTTLRNVVDNNISCGILSAVPTIIDNNNGSCTISACNVQIRALNSQTDKLLFLPVPSATLSITQAATEYIYVNYSAGTCSYIVSSSIVSNYQTMILVAQIYRVPLAESNELYINSQVCSCIQDIGKKVINFTGAKLGKIIYESGAILSFSGVQFAITVGNFNMALNMFSTQAKSLSTNFKYLSYNGSVWSELTATNNIDNVNYQGASGFTTINNSQWSVDFVYVTVDATTKYYIIKATSQATSLANALAISVPSNVPQRLINNGILIGKIVFQKSQNINSVFSNFTTALTFQGVTNHGSLGNLTTDDHPQYALLAGRTDETETLYINNISSFSAGTDKDFTLSTKGSGRFVINIDPTANGGFIMKSPNMTNLTNCDLYFGRYDGDTSNFGFMGYQYSTVNTANHSYLGVFGTGAVNKRIKIYASGILNIPGDLDALNADTTEGKTNIIRTGSDDTNCAYMKYTYSATEANRKLTIGYQGKTENFESHGDGKGYFTVENGTVNGYLYAGTVTRVGSSGNCAHSWIQIVGDTYGTTEGCFGYDSSLHALVYYNNTGKMVVSAVAALQMQNLIKSVESDKIAKVEIKADRVITNYIFPKKSNEIVTIYNFGFSENSPDFQAKYGCMGVDDFGFWGMNKLGMKCYFISNNSYENEQTKKNVSIQSNNHVLYDNVNKLTSQNKQQSEIIQKQQIEIKLLQKQVQDLFIEIEMIKKQIQKKNNTELDIGTDSPRNGLGNSLNFINSYYPSK